MLILSSTTHPSLSGRPLFHPCKCIGSIRYIHQECLMQWMRHSKKEFCELCKHPIKFQVGNKLCEYYCLQLSVCITVIEVIAVIDWGQDLRRSRGCCFEPGIGVDFTFFCLNLYQIFDFSGFFSLCLSTLSMEQPKSQSGH